MSDVRPSGIVLVQHHPDGTFAPRYPDGFDVLSRAALQAGGTVRRGAVVTITAEHLGLTAAALPMNTSTRPPVQPNETLKSCLERFKREMIRDAVSRHDGNWAAAGRELGLHRSNLFKLAGRGAWV